MELLRFYAEDYLVLLRDLRNLHTNLALVESDAQESNDGRSSFPLKETEIAAAVALFRDIGHTCAIIGARVTAKHAYELGLKREWHTSDAQGLEDNLRREFEERYFVSVPTDRIERFEKPRDKWLDVLKQVPNASDDVEEMNRCYALCRYPAAVFHSLLVVEHGLVELGRLVGVTDPKEGWDASCKKLAEIVAAGHNKNTTGLSFASLEQINNCVQSMKFAWRNKVNHATGKPHVMSGGFVPDVANEIITATAGFMRRLAEELATRTATP